MKKIAMLLTLVMLLQICTCFSANALEDTSSDQLLVGLEYEVGTRRLAGSHQ